MDEVYIKINEKCKYPYRAVDKDAQTIDFLPIVHRGNQVFFKETVWQQGLLNKITIDKSGDNNVDIEGFKEEDGKEIYMRQMKYLNNLVEQWHQSIKRIVRPMLGLISFHSIRTTLQGI